MINRLSGVGACSRIGSEMGSRQLAHSKAPAAVSLRDVAPKLTRSLSENADPTSHFGAFRVEWFH